MIELMVSWLTRGIWRTVVNGSPETLTAQKIRKLVMMSTGIEYSNRRTTNINT